MSGMLSPISGQVPIVVRGLTGPTGLACTRPARQPQVPIVESTGIHSRQVPIDDFVLQLLFGHDLPQLNEIGRVMTNFQLQFETSY